MSLRAIQLALPARVRELAPRLAGRSGAFLLRSPRRGAVYLGAEPIELVQALDPEPALALHGWAGGSEAAAASRDEPLALARRGSTLGRAPRWVGLLPYEAARSLERPAWLQGVESRPPPLLSQPLWARYGAVLELTDRVLLIGDDPAAMRSLRACVEAPAAAGSGRAARARVVAGASDEDSADHAERVRAALELIYAGEIYQVNLARRLDFEVAGHPIDLLLALGRAGWAPYAAAIDAAGCGVVASSPELCLALEPGGWAVTEPIKGTRPRGRDAVGERALVAELDADPKERAELTMVVDVERNDLSRVAETGSVRMSGSPRILTLPTVHHRVARVAGRIGAAVTRSDLLAAMLPSGSVTGAPKVRAMEVIAGLESHRRGLYTGAYGMLSHDGSLELAMAIRMLGVRDGVGHYFTGGGIVAESDPLREVEETRWKARQLEAWFAGAAAG